ncbi:MAG: hypothetical protein Edafosvirus6_35 [Edafosvirus sp.]|uniref:Uncharacterized protein n=1 Tax=Edafosvirus sp. TaxID=2487765 RepID=A0A3G4ZTG0_9VIRU|nr:MAG: hypothetical protein Edafosvirus6_35 [Edafosvirus sp.]
MIKNILFCNVKNLDSFDFFKNKFISMLEDKYIKDITLIFSHHMTIDDRCKFLKSIVTDTEFICEKKLAFSIDNEKKFFEAFDKFLQQNKIITKIHFLKVNLVIAECKILNQILQNNKQIKIVEFNNDNLVYGTVVSDYDVIFKDISLCEIRINKPCLSELVNLMSNTTIESICISVNEHIFINKKNDIKYDDHFINHTFLNALNSTISLKEINVHYDNIDFDTSIINFLKMIFEGKNKSIKKLSIASPDNTVGFHRKINEIFQKYIPINNTITELNLEINSENIECLIKNQTIEKIFIRNIYGADESVNLLEKLILKNKHITNYKINFTLVQEHCEIIKKAINGTGIIEKFTCVPLCSASNNTYADLLDEVNNVKMKRNQCIGTSLDLFVGHQIIPMINIIKEYSDLI